MQKEAYNNAKLRNGEKNDCEEFRETNRQNILKFIKILKKKFHKNSKIIFEC